MAENRDIKFLLDLYDKAYVDGEHHGNEYKQKIRHESKRKNRHLIFNGLVNEMNQVSLLKLNSDQSRLVRYFIDDFNNDFKQLHRKASEEAIILAFMFYVKKLENPSIRLENYSICSKYNLSSHVFEIILCRMMLNFIDRCPLRPVESFKDNYDMLQREGIR